MLLNLPDLWKTTNKKTGGLTEGAGRVTGALCDITEANDGLVPFQGSSAESIGELWWILHDLASLKCASVCKNLTALPIRYRKIQTLVLQRPV